ncbi:MAG: thymidine phosphorylase [Planctomycetota bacterium]
MPVSTIRQKRDGEALSDAQIGQFIEGYVRGDVADYQMAAMAMAMCLRGLNTSEIASLTRHMLESGTPLTRVTDRPRIDKHSTGGLGDKVSLILAPLLACFDVEVPMISGRGLGRTGGTLDKLEAIPGFQTQLPDEVTTDMLSSIGAFIVGATEAIAPADRKLYGLRDVTATVESIGLITASILSKKLSASLDALVIDVKVGSAAFMPTIEEARQLAHSLVDVGQSSGLPTMAMLSDMDQPLGVAIGNAIEVNESLDVLAGGGPPRVRQLTIGLSASLLKQAGAFASLDEARELLTQKLADGSAHEKFMTMVRAQGGLLDGPLPLDPISDIVAERDGHVTAIDCREIADAVIAMGGGRRRTGDQLDFGVGIAMQVEIGDVVSKGDVLMQCHATPEKHAAVVNQLKHSVKIQDEPVKARELILETIGSETA